MPMDRALGWQITVERPGGVAAEVYNVAIADGQEAIEAVKRVLEDRDVALLKLKGELTAKLYKALRMNPGDVLSGAQPRKKRPSNQTGVRKEKRPQP
jgi:hypothetical protein